MLYVVHGSLYYFISAASSLTDATIDPAEYTLTTQLNERLTLHVKIVGVSDFWELHVHDYRPHYYVAECPMLHPEQLQSAVEAICLIRSL